MKPPFCRRLKLSDELAGAETLIIFDKLSKLVHEVPVMAF